ncbi:tetratricopeptide repeat protein [Altererythrobacter xixiisoli]|uniref:Tetratricopeptide repeat protein n=1 Tax=Croceibacterium xixiisoli TaxID=1476466 RepID=A0A6I4TZC7_9SPHN|nr:tetratricopeptide repeat protein [Croceibacterium xixiisoli]MXO99968.1 tetratricopeptide repeat protein [Croceibacterium xixiisoli]
MAYRVPLLAALLLPALSLLAACSGSDVDPEEGARTALAAGDYVVAREYLAAALKASPADPELLELLARTRLGLGEGDATIATLNRLATEGRLPADAALLYAEAELQRDAPEEAVKRLADDSSAPAWRIRALAAVRQGDREQAAHAFSAGTRAEGPKADLLVNYAYFLLEDDDVPGARRIANIALADSPKHIDTMLLDARISQRELRNSAALARYREILASIPAHREALLGAISVLGAAGELDEVQTLLARGMENAPGDPEFIYISARLAAEKNDWVAVRRILQQTEMSLADFPEANSLYSQAMLEMGQAEQARARLVGLVRDDPENPMIRRLYARALMDLGDFAEARQAIEPLANMSGATREDIDLYRRASAN